MQVHLQTIFIYLITHCTITNIVGNAVFPSNVPAIVDVLKFTIGRIWSDGLNVKHTPVSSGNPALQISRVH